MAEEIRNPAVVLPWSLLSTLLVNGTLGFGMIIATLYCLGDIDSALADDAHYPFMPILRNALGSTAGAAVLSSVIVFMTFAAATGALASTSRIYWAFARDRALPGWRILKKTTAKTNIPIYAVLTTTVLSIVLSLINIGNAAAFNGVISISIIGVLGSYCEYCREPFTILSCLLPRNATSEGAWELGCRAGHSAWLESALPPTPPFLFSYNRYPLSPFFLLCPTTA
jgi:amino acid transporter